MSIDLYPAIDLRGGRCVRLHQGDFDAETVYDDDPVRVARSFVDAGASWLHVVDLDAARTGEPVHHELVGEICRAVPARVQTGGGVRSIERAEALLDAGAARVVVGTAAFFDPQMVVDLHRARPEAVVVGLDHRGGRIAVEGWKRDLDLGVANMAWIFGSSATALAITDIGRDGTLEGPDLDELAEVLDATPTPVIASGGVGSIADLETLTRLDVGGRRVAGVIVGKAIYDGRISVEDALATLAGRR